MVFQNYALYPHMTVAQNLAFGLRFRKLPKSEINERVGRAAELLEIDEYLDKKPRALSGGQRQRVAMGRAIVREPQAFLMDEPLSNLDAKLRVQMRGEIHDLQRRLERDDALRHARPGRGDDAGRPRRRDARRTAAAGRPSAGALRASGQRVRGGIHRLAVDQHGRGRARTLERRTCRELRRAPSRRRRRRRPRPARASRTMSAAPSCSGSAPSTSRTRRSSRMPRRTGAFAPPVSSPSRSEPRCSCTSRCLRRSWSRALRSDADPTLGAAPPGSEDGARPARRARGSAQQDHGGRARSSSPSTRAASTSSIPRLERGRLALDGAGREAGEDPPLQHERQHDQRHGHDDGGRHDLAPRLLEGALSGEARDGDGHRVLLG